MKMHFELTPEEQIVDLRKRMERVGYRNLWLECESDGLKAVIRDQRKEIDTLYALLLEEFQKSSEKT